MGVSLGRRAAQVLTPAMHNSFLPTVALKPTHQVTGPQRRQVLKSKLMLTVHSEQKLAGEKLWEVILREDTLSGEVGNVKKKGWSAKSERSIKDYSTA